ncbi:MAG: Sec-independent protein translocase protein TatB [Methylococcaceae bacterium]
MFEIGFWELVLVSLVALLVFGPEKLPGLVREVFAVIRKIQGVASSARDQISRELELQELKQTLQEQKRLLNETLKEPDQHSENREGGKHEHQE